MGMDLYKQALVMYKTAQQATGTLQVDKELPIRVTDEQASKMRQVESENGTNLYGDYMSGKPRTPENARAWGPYQIHKEYWDDAMEYLGIDWPYEDRMDEAKSRLAMDAYMSRYLSKYGPNPSFERIVRTHNGGPDGYFKDATLGYWGKYKKRDPKLRTAAARTAASPAAASPGAYSVQPGDTLYGLWKKSPAGLGWSDYVTSVQSANPGLDINKLSPGMSLKLPGAAQEHTVGEGDTAWGLWKKYGQGRSWQQFQSDLRNHNKGLDISKLAIGAKVRYR